MAARPLSHVRSLWFAEVVVQCQRFIGTAICNPSSSINSIAASFVAALPDAETAIEDVALRGLLFDVAAGWGAQIHNQAHRTTTKSRCEFIHARLLEEFAAQPHHRATSRFLRWARVFDLEFTRHHPASPSQYAAAIIRAQTKDISTVELAQRVGFTARQLSRDFRRTFGISLAKYRRVARLLRALDLMIDEKGKIEPVALQVGYRSKKNFYRSFRQSLGMTPHTFLRLSPESARDLIESARLIIEK